MSLYNCRFCDYNNKVVSSYYCHLYSHIDLDNIELFSREELEKANYYINKKKEYSIKFAKYYQNNKDKILEYQKEYNKKYRENNKEKLRQYKKEYDKIYRENNKEKITEKNKIYYQKNKEKISEKRKESMK
jgi:hypothetical protein